jgi:BRCA1-associated protein
MGMVRYFYPRPRSNQSLWPSGPAVATFVPHRTKSGSMNLPEGTVHLFRNSAPKPAVEMEPDEEPPSSPTDGVMLAVLAVPSWMTPSDFLGFVAPAAEGMAHLRMIRYVFLDHARA